MSSFPIGGRLFANRYLLHSKIGEGGIGQVWLAEDVENDNQVVAVKFPKEQFRSQTRFIDEAKLMAGIEHKSIIKISCVGQDEVFGEYYAMEYFPDGSLTDFLLKPACHFAKSWPNDSEIRYVSLQQAITILRPVAQALDYVHKNWPETMHRDLKLSNILVDHKNNRYVLADFSLQMGAPSIMSPEQLLVWKEPQRQQALDWHSDLFSFGACLYKLTTGTYPFQIKANPTSVEAIEEVFRYQFIDNVPPEYPCDRNPANMDLHNPEVNQLIWQLVSKTRTGRTLNGRVNKMEDALDLLAQTQKAQSKNMVTALFVAGIFLFVLLLVVFGLVLSGGVVW